MLQAVGGRRRHLTLQQPTLGPTRRMACHCSSECWRWQLLALRWEHKGSSRLCQSDMALINTPKGRGANGKPALDTASSSSCCCTAATPAMLPPKATFWLLPAQSSVSNALQVALHRAGAAWCMPSFHAGGVWPCLLSGGVLHCFAAHPPPQHSEPSRLLPNAADYTAPQGTVVGLRSCKDCHPAGCCTLRSPSARQPCSVLCPWQSCAALGGRCLLCCAVLCCAPALTFSVAASTSSWIAVCPAAGCHASPGLGSGSGGPAGQQ